MTQRLVFLFDVDNTLLDNDSIAADLKSHLENEVGHERQERYWSIFEDLRKQVGYADYLGALQLYRATYPRDLHVLTVSHFLLTYPFATRLYSKALYVVEYVKQFGQPVILSDGDVVFQPHKIRRSGLYDAFVERRYPADHYALVDDKVRLLTAIKNVWGSRVTTVFPRQGHYAMDARAVASYPPPDHTIERIADLVHLDLNRIVLAH